MHNSVPFWSITSCSSCTQVSRIWPYPLKISSCQLFGLWFRCLSILLHSTCPPRTARAPGNRRGGAEWWGCKWRGIWGVLNWEGARRHSLLHGKTPKTAPAEQRDRICSCTSFYSIICIKDIINPGHYVEGQALHHPWITFKNSLPYILQEKENSMKFIQLILSPLLPVANLSNCLLIINHL